MNVIMNKKNSVENLHNHRTIFVEIADFKKFILNKQTQLLPHKIRNLFIIILIF